MTPSHFAPGAPALALPSRRAVLGGLGIGLAAAALPMRARAVSSLFDMKQVAPQRVVDLAVQEAELSFGGYRRIARTINGTLPGPILRFREGDEVLIRVHNQLQEDTSIHWHGMKLPAGMDGVPGVSFPGIKPGETFEYRYTLRQSGTYWYHSHSGLQEPEGMYGALIIDPRDGREPFAFERDYAIVLSEWTPEAPSRVMRNLKSIDGYYNYHKPTLPAYLAALRNAKDQAERRRIREERLAWMRMRMDPSDISDGPEDTVFLMHGHDPEQGFTALYTPGDRVRLRLINGTALTFLDVRIPGLKMTVVQADGQNVVPVEVDELRIGNGETYDVIVQPQGGRAYAIVAEAMARTGMAVGMLTPRAGLVAEVPPLRERPVRSLSDMAGHAGHGAPAAPAQDPHAGHALTVAPDPHAGHGAAPVADPHAGHGAAGTATATAGGAYRKLAYSDLRALSPQSAPAPTLEVQARLTGVMWRYIWTVNGEKLGESEPVRVRLGQRVRLSMVNETMMEHPMHLHGFFARLENGQGTAGPMKHTFIVKPAETVVAEFTADAPGPWVFHCHLFFHAMAGMGMAFLVEGDNNKKG